MYPVSQVPTWFERKFDFNFPIEQFPNLCIRLRGTPPRLEEIIRDVPHRILVNQMGDRWSAQEHAGHLVDLEPLWLARLENFLTEGDRLTVADLSNRRTYEANHNARTLMEILVEFRSARLHLADRLETLQPELFSRSLLHPRLKQPMRLVDHLYFVAEHDDHHMARVWELIGH
jgi:uncharacterized damage-inducible protein DinB